MIYSEDITFGGVSAYVHTFPISINILIFFYNGKKIICDLHCYWSSQIGHQFLEVTLPTITLETLLMLDMGIRLDMNFMPVNVMEGDVSCGETDSARRNNKKHLLEIEKLHVWNDGSKVRFFQLINRYCEVWR